VAPVHERRARPRRGHLRPDRPRRRRRFGDGAPPGGTARGRLPAIAPGAARPARDVAGGRPRDHGGRARLGAGAARPPPRRARAPAHRRRRLPRRRRQGGAARAAGAVDRRPQDDRAVRGRRLDAPARRARHALHLPRTPSRRRLGRSDRLPPRAVPRRRARAVRVHPVRRRHPSVPRCRVRDARDARGAARGRRALRAAPRPSRGRAHAAAGDHAHARAWGVRGAGGASVSATPCRCSAVTIA
jgi:hypothetical protein